MRDIIGKKPIFSMRKILQLWLPVALFLSITSTYAVQPEYTDIAQFQTVRGPVIHQEDRTGRSHFFFVNQRQRLALSPAWKDLNVEQATQLIGQTAVVFSFRDKECPSRMSLLVIDQLVNWGPYQVGNCEDILVHQVGEDGNDYIAIKADGSAGEAYMYSAVERRFRGPVKVDLPPSMAAMVPKAASSRAPAAKPAVKKPAPAPAMPADVSRKEATAIADQARKAPAQRPIQLNL